jgi:hypothetical protein
MAHASGEDINLTIRVDSGILMLAKHRALLERTTVNQHLADALEDYADGAMDVARRSTTAAYVYGVVEEIRRLRRTARLSRRADRAVIRGNPEAESLVYEPNDRGAEPSTDS